MTAVVFAQAPGQVEDLLEERRRLGLDRRDEVWDGVYHVAPEASLEHSEIQGAIVAWLRQLAAGQGWRATASFNLGTDAGRGNYRVPDFGVHATIPAGARFVPSALIVGEILSPEDESYLKFSFYFANDVAEVFIVDPARRAAEIWARGPEAFVETETSGVFSGIGAADLAAVAFPND